MRTHLESVGNLHDPAGDPNRYRLSGAWQNGHSILQTLGQQGMLREDILALIAVVAAETPDKHRKSVANVCTELFRPLHCPLERLADDLRRLANDLQRSPSDSMALWTARIACSEVLAATHEDNFTVGRTFTLRYQSLIDHPTVRALRTAAMQLLAVIVSAGRYIDAIAIARAIGKANHMAGMGKGDLALRDVFTAEREEFLGWIAPVEVAAWALADLHHLEELCRSWWVGGYSDTATESLLRRLPRTPLHRLFLRHSSHIVIDDYTAVFTQVGAHDRWSWLLEHRDNRPFQPTPTSVLDDQQLAEDLAGAYEESAAVVGALVQLTNALHEIERGGFGTSVLERWVRLTPEVFRNAIADSAWAQVGRQFHCRVIGLLACERPETFSLAREQVLHSHGSDLNAVDRFLLGYAETTPPLPEVLTEMQIIARQVNPHIRANLLRSIWNAQTNRVTNLHHALIRECLAVGYDKQLVQPIDWLHHRTGGIARDEIPADILDALITGLAKQPNLNHDDRHHFETMTDCSPTAFCTFIERRLQHARVLLSAAEAATSEFELFPEEIAWSKPSDWTQDQMDAYVELLLRHVSVVDELRPFRGLWSGGIEQALPTSTGIALVRTLTGGDPVRSTAAWSLLRHANAGSAVSRDSLREACEWLIAQGRQEDVRKWLCRWGHGTVSHIGEDGVSGSMHAAIALMASLKQDTNDPRLKLLLGDVLRELEHDRKHMRSYHLAVDP